MDSSSVSDVDKHWNVLNTSRKQIKYLKGHQTSNKINQNTILI